MKDEEKAEEQDRLRRVAEQRARNVERLRSEYGELSDEEVVADLVPSPGQVLNPLVMTMRLLTALGELATELGRLEARLKRTERLTWALVLLTLALIGVTLALLVRG